MPKQKLDAATFEAKAKAIVARIAAERDKLRTLVEDYASILQETDEAVDQFENGLDTLSRLL